MPELQLTPRLASIAKLMPQGARLADIGTDHALLPIYLLLKGTVCSAIASDMREGPLENAVKNAKIFRCHNRLSLRLGAGLEKISPSECDTIVIAGMGGKTIVEILHDAPWTRAGNHNLLLQPMTMIPELRQYLWSHNFKIKKELVCSEDRRYYLVLHVIGVGKKDASPVPGISNCYYSKALLQDPRAQEYLSALLRRERNALNGMLKGQSTSFTQIVRQRHIVQSIAKVVEEDLW